MAARGSSVVALDVVGRVTGRAEVESLLTGEPGTVLVWWILCGLTGGESSRGRHWVREAGVMGRRLEVLVDDVRLRIEVSSLRWLPAPDPEEGHAFTRAVLEALGDRIAALEDATAYRERLVRPGDTLRLTGRCRIARVRGGGYRGERVVEIVAEDHPLTATELLQL